MDSFPLVARPTRKRRSGHNSLKRVQMVSQTFNVQVLLVRAQTDHKDTPFAAARFFTFMLSFGDKSRRENSCWILDHLG